MSIAQMAIAVLVVCGIVGIVFIVARQAGVEVPGWASQIFWIVVAVLVGVFAIRFLIGVM